MPPLLVGVVDLERFDRSARSASRVEGSQRTGTGKHADPAPSSTRRRVRTGRDGMEAVILPTYDSSSNSDLEVTTGLRAHIGDRDAGMHSISVRP